MRFFIFTLVLFPALALAQENGMITVGTTEVSYDSSDVSEEASYYYQGNSLVASKHGQVTLVYENDKAILEAHDTDGDGALDAFLELDTDSQVINITGEGASKFAERKPVEFAELLSKEEGGGSEASTPEDLVGDLSDIKIPKYHNYKFYTMTFILLGGAYWWYRRNGKGDK